MARIRAPKFPRLSTSSASEESDVTEAEVQSPPNAVSTALETYSEKAESVFTNHLIVNVIIQHVQKVMDLMSCRLIKRCWYAIATKKMKPLAKLDLTPLGLHYPPALGCYDEGLSAYENQVVFFAKLNYTMRHSKIFPLSTVTIHPSLWKWSNQNVQKFLNSFGDEITDVTLGYEKMTKGKLRQLLLLRLPNIERLTFDSSLQIITGGGNRIFPSAWSTSRLVKLRVIRIKLKSFVWESTRKFRNLMDSIAEVIGAASNLKSLKGVHPFLFPVLAGVNKVEAVRDMVFAPSLWNFHNYEDFSLLRPTLNSLVIRSTRVHDDAHRVVLTRFLEGSALSLKKLHIEEATDCLVDGIRLPCLENLERLDLSDLCKIGFKWIISSVQGVFPNLTEIIIDKQDSISFARLNPFRTEVDNGSEMILIPSVKLVRVKRGIIVDRIGQIFLASRFPNATILR